MDPPGGIQPVAADEILYRRIPKAWYNPADGLSNESFLPSAQDIDGLSLSREKVGAIGTSATGWEGKEYYVASIRAADLPVGLTPQPDTDEHLVLPQMTFEARKHPSTKGQIRAWAEQMRSHCAGRVKGPFPGRTPQPVDRA